MRKSRTNDLFILARVALEAEVRDRDDLLALPNDPAPTRAPAKVALVEAVTLA